MAMKFRSYTKQAGITEDYYKIRILVGSYQQFYYSIGLRPYTTSTI